MQRNLYNRISCFFDAGMLAVMMFGVLLIIGTIDDAYTVNLLSGGYGIYYKLMQIALFASFGLSNTLITITSYNYGRKDETRVRETIKHGIFASVVLTAVLTLVYQAFAEPIAELFVLTMEESSVVSKNDVVEVCITALRIATIGYVFMGFSVGIQGVLQGFNEVYSPLIISALRLLVLVLPIAFFFSRLDNVTVLLWWTFPIAEVVTAFVACFFLKNAVKKHLLVPVK